MRLRFASLQGRECKMATVMRDEKKDRAELSAVSPA